MTPTRSRMTAFFVLAAGLGAATTARADDLSFRCTNQASGTSWTVTVDEQKRTADGAPANISARHISWRDAQTGGSYDLDRSSGDLTFVNSSSMGGYMLFHRCKQN